LPVRTAPAAHFPLRRLDRPAGFTALQHGQIAENPQFYWEFVSKFLCEARIHFPHCGGET
jgi:hypothetical protein